jgi:hypothetical protein
MRGVGILPLRPYNFFVIIPGRRLKARASRPGL